MSLITTASYAAVGSAVAVASSAIGGTVQAILAQQYLRAAIVYALWGMGINYNAPEVYVAGVPVSARTQEVYQYKAEATRFAIESGANYTDHVILEPIRIDLYFEVANILPGAAEYALNLFEEMYKARQPLDLLTEFKKIPNMVMTSFHAENQAPFWKRLVCQATFEQINKVTLETQPSDVKPTENTSTPDNSKSAEPAAGTGQQTPPTQQPSGNSSVLHDVVFGKGN